MVFKTLREIGRQVRDSVAEGVQQYQQQQMELARQQNLQNGPQMLGPSYNQPLPYHHLPSHYQTFPSHVDPVLNPSLRFGPAAGQTSWGLLILPDKTTPSAHFVRLLDAIFALALHADNSCTADILTPTRLAAVYDELGYAHDDNLPFLLFRHAQQCGDGSPHARVNAGMEMAWRIFGLEYTAATITTAPGLTRQGFRTMMVRDGLIYPVGQAKAHSALLARYRDRLSAQGVAAFPAGPLETESLMPPGVPATGDAETQNVYKERQAVWAREYRCRFGGGQGELGVGMGAADVATAMQMATFRHNMTMDAMTPGYRVPDGRGGYNYHYTGGLNW
ncbi:hypothetical protein RB595_004231 [Gaeumannomyces hyphopodioides]